MRYAMWRFSNFVAEVLTWKHQHKRGHHKKAGNNSSSPKRPDWPWSPFSILFLGTGDPLPGKVAGVQVWPITLYYEGLLVPLCGPGSSDGIATDYGLDSPGSNPGGDEIFRSSRPALGPAQPPVKWVPGLSRRYSAAGACCWPLTHF